MQDNTSADDEMTADTESVLSVPERNKYTVTSESGLFKNGKQYDQGDIVDLDEKTAENFINAGEVEAAENGE